MLDRDHSSLARFGSTARQQHAHVGAEKWMSVNSNYPNIYPLKHIGTFVFKFHMDTHTRLSHLFEMVLGLGVSLLSLEIRFLLGLRYYVRMCS